LRTYLGAKCLELTAGWTEGEWTVTDKPSEHPPIACTLGAGDFRTRLAWIAELNDLSLRDHHQDDLRLELVYAPEAREQVRDMVRREQACCAFLSFQVVEEPGDLRVVISAPEAAREAARTLFEPFRSKTDDQAGR
jgi:hypothetical protein